MCHPLAGVEQRTDELWETEFSDGDNNDVTTLMI